MLFERPIVTVLLLASVPYNILRSGELDLLRLLTLAVSAYVILWIIWSRGRKKNVSHLSKTVLSEDGAVLSMQILDRVAGKEEHFAAPGFSRCEPGKLEQLVVSFENHTGAPVVVDHTYFLERKIRGKWYDMETECSTTSEETPLKLEDGKSESICFSSVKKYGVLPSGDYRIVKTFDTETGQMTIAAPFTIRESF